MKKCISCGATFASGKFCGKCGSPTEDIQIVVPTEPINMDSSASNSQPQPGQEQKPEIQQSTDNLEAVEKKQVAGVTEKVDVIENKVKKGIKINFGKFKVKENSEKKSLGKLKIALILVAVLIVGFLGLSAFYLGNSQVDVGGKSKFDEATFKAELKSDFFDGETVDFELPEEGINYYVKQHIKNTDIPSVLLGSEVSSAIYKDGLLYIQVDGSFVHTTLVATISAKVSDGKLVLEVDKLSLGKWSMPVSKGIVNKKDGFPVEVALPQYLTLEDFELSDEVTAKIVLKADYFDALAKDALESIDLDLIEYVRYNSPNYERIYNARESVLNGDSEALKTLRYELINDKEYLADFASLMPRDKADEMLNKIVTDSINYDKEAYDELVSLIDIKSAEMSEVIRSFQMDRVAVAGKTVIQALYDYISSKDGSYNFIAYEGKPYVPSIQSFVSASDLIEFLGDTVPSSFAYELFYDGYYVVVGVQTDDAYYLIDDWDTMEETTKEDAYERFGYKASSTLKQGELLSRQNADRSSIAEVVSAYIGSDNSIYIRYLKSDSEWAVLISSPGDYPQEISQFILRKTNGIWTVMAQYYDSDILTDYIGSDLIESGFNVSLLPPFEVYNHSVWYLDSYEISEIQYHLAELGLASEYDEVSYVSRVDDILAITIGDKKFIFIFEEGSGTTYKEVVTVATGENYMDYIDKLTPLYTSPVPSFVFIQD